MTEAALSFEISVNFHMSTRQHISEDRNFQGSTLFLLTFQKEWPLWYYLFIQLRLMALCTSNFLMVWGNGSLATIFSPLVKPASTTEQLLSMEYKCFGRRTVVLVHFCKKWSGCIQQMSYPSDSPPVSSPELLCAFQTNLKLSIFRYIFSKSSIHDR